MTGKLRALFTDDAPAGWLPVREAIRAHGVSRETLLQRVKHGELHAVHIRTGRAKGLRIEPPPAQTGLFLPTQSARSRCHAHTITAPVHG